DGRSDSKFGTENTRSGDLEWEGSEGTEGGTKYCKPVQKQERKE
ncbi:hypothetical protein GE061_017793, partial [Apolygus lucorum]